MGDLKFIIISCLIALASYFVLLTVLKNPEEAFYGSCIIIVVSYLFIDFIAKSSKSQ